MEGSVLWFLHKEKPGEPWFGVLWVRPRVLRVLFGKSSDQDFQKKKGMKGSVLWVLHKEKLGEPWFGVPWVRPRVLRVLLGEP